MLRKFAKGATLDPVNQAGGDAVGPVLDGMRPICPVLYVWTVTKYPVPYDLLEPRSGQ